MENQKIKAIGQVEMDIPLCPYCGTMPRVHTHIAEGARVIFKQKDEQESVSTRTISCDSCGLSACETVWRAIAEKIDEAISPEE